MFHNFFFGGMWFGWIFWIVLIALVIWLVLNHGSRNRQNNQPPQQASSLDTIKTRYAKGEITKEQFEQMKKDLS
jgi:putative membrane protein